MRGDTGPERALTLYGRADGTWAFLDSPIGWISPPRIGDLRLLCDASAALLIIYLQIPGAGNTGRGTRYPAQEMLARRTGLGQQAISRHVSRTAWVPEMEDAGWRAVARLLYAWTEWPDCAADMAIVGEFLASGDAITAERRAAREAMSAPETPKSPGQPPSPEGPEG